MAYMAAGYHLSLECLIFTGVAWELLLQTSEKLGPVAPVEGHSPTQGITLPPGNIVLSTPFKGHS